MELTLTEIIKLILLLLLVICAVSVNFTKSLLQAPDLAITEAAVGAGVSGTLFLLTLRRIRSEHDSPDSGDGISGREDNDV